MIDRAIKIALLPFENLSGAAEDARLATGFVQDLTTEIARFPSLGVIAAHSSFAAVAADLDDQGIGRRLGVGYLLRGSVRRSGKMIRIHVALVELNESRHLWAEKYDVPGDELFQLQDEIVARVANALSLRIDHSALSSSRGRHLTSLAVYECWLRGMECLLEGSDQSDVEARKYFQQALEQDPLYARACGGMSLSHFNEWSCQAWHQWEEKERNAYECARQAEALDPNDQVVQVILGRIEQYRRQFDTAATRFEKALQLAPNDASTLIQLAACFAYNGNPTLGLDLSDKALSLNPLCPGWHFTFAAIPLFMAKRYEEAARMAAKGPGLVDTAAYLAAAYAYQGRTERATFFLKEFMETFRKRITYGREPEPGEAMLWLRHVNPFRREEDMAHFLEGVRLAGLEGVPVEKDERVEEKEAELARHEDSPEEKTSAPVSPAPVPMKWPVANQFRKEGGQWTAAFDHEVVQLQDLRGYHDLVRLLSNPGEEVHCLQLAGEADAPRPAGQGVEMLDEKARRAYQTRLQEIDDELAEATAHADSGRSLRLETEREALVEEIKRATGLGGRSRKMGDAAERARTAITWRIRHAIKRLETLHPSLARHLANSVRTGVFCSYVPERATEWRV